MRMIKTITLRVKSIRNDNNNNEENNGNSNND